MTNPLLPPRPDFYSAADRARLNPSIKPTPQQKRTGLALIFASFEKQLNNHPMLQPLKARIETRGADGFSLHVDFEPMSGDDDVTVPGGSGT